MSLLLALKLLLLLELEPEPALALLLALKPLWSCNPSQSTSAPHSSNSLALESFSRISQH
jgi:hypothetical protein